MYLLILQTVEPLETYIGQPSYVAKGFGFGHYTRYFQLGNTCHCKVTGDISKQHLQVYVDLELKYDQTMTIKRNGMKYELWYNDKMVDSCDVADCGKLLFWVCFLNSIKI